MLPMLGTGKLMSIHTSAFMAAPVFASVLPPHTRMDRDKLSLASMSPLGGVGDCAPTP